MDISKFITGECMKKALIILPVVGLLLVTLAVAQVSQDISVTAEVPSYYSVVFQYNTVNFGSVYPGYDIPAPGNQGEYYVTVETNIGLIVTASRTAWSPSDILLLKFASALNEIPTAPEYEIGTTPITVDAIVPGFYTHYHAYWLDVPMGTSPGTYSTTVTITYQPAA